MKTLCNNTNNKRNNYKSKTNNKSYSNNKYNNDKGCNNKHIYTNIKKKDNSKIIEEIKSRYLDKEVIQKSNNKKQEKIEKSNIIVEDNVEVDILDYNKESINNSIKQTFGNDNTADIVECNSINDNNNNVNNYLINKNNKPYINKDNYNNYNHNINNNYTNSIIPGYTTNKLSIKDLIDRENKLCVNKNNFDIINSNNPNTNYDCYGRNINYFFDNELNYISYLNYLHFINHFKANYPNNNTIPFNNLIYNVNDIYNKSNKNNLNNNNINQYSFNKAECKNNNISVNDQNKNLTTNKSKSIDKNTHNNNYNEIYEDILNNTNVINKSKKINNDNNYNESCDILANDNISSKNNYVLGEYNSNSNIFDKYSVEKESKINNKNSKTSKILENTIINNKNSNNDMTKNSFYSNNINNEIDNFLNDFKIHKKQTEERSRKLNRLLNKAVKSITKSKEKDNNLNNCTALNNNNNKFYNLKVPNLNLKLVNKNSKNNTSYTIIKKNFDYTKNCKVITKDANSSITQYHNDSNIDNEDIEEEYRDLEIELSKINSNRNSKLKCSSKKNSNSIINYEILSKYEQELKNSVSDITLSYDINDEINKLKKIKLEKQKIIDLINCKNKNIMLNKEEKTS